MLRTSVASTHSGRHYALAALSSRTWNLVGKRALDVVICGGLLLLLLPLLVTIGLLVRCTSPGPAVFRQQRVGRDGRLFWFYKFRTMIQANDASAHRAYYQQL